MCVTDTRSNEVNHSFRPKSVVGGRVTDPEVFARVRICISKQTRSGSDPVSDIWSDLDPVYRICMVRSGLNIKI